MGVTSELWSRFKGLVFCQLCMAIVFLTTGLIVDIVQAVLYLTLRPFDPTLYRRINFYVSYMLNSQVTFLVEWWSGSYSDYYIDPDVVNNYLGKEHALLLLNHGCEVDWLMGWSICDNFGVLGNARVYAKRVLQYAPVLGWSWKFQEMVFLDRNWEKDRRNLGTQLRRLAAYPSPIWLTLFPEGTRFTQTKYEASMKVAREKGLPELKHHLLPRTRGFVASIPYLREKVPAIYDVIVAVHPECKNEPSVYSLLRGKSVRTTLLIRRIPMSTVPEGEKEAADWLQTLYQQKDKVLDNYIKLGEFVPESDRNKEEYKDYKNFETINLTRRKQPLINFCFWAAVILIPLWWYLYLQLTSGSLVRIFVVGALCAAANLGFNVLINLTKISKGSSYGSSNKNNGNNVDTKNRYANGHANGHGDSILNGEVNSNNINGNAKLISKKLE